MSKLKNIDLSELGVKTKKLNLMKEETLPFVGERMMEKRKMDGLHNNYEEECTELKLAKSPPYTENINMNYPKNGELLPFVKLIETNEKNENQYVDNYWIEWEEVMDPEEFLPSSKQLGITIPLTFRKYFSDVLPIDIFKLALENPAEIPDLIDNAQKLAWKSAVVFLDRQINTLLCQVDNYGSEAKIYKKKEDFQKIEIVLQWIIDIECQMRHDSLIWNKDGVKSFSERKQLLLIINTSLYRRIQIADYHEKERVSFDKKEARKNPLPLREMSKLFAAVISFPLKNNFQFIIIDKKALVGWYKFANSGVKYDEENKLTYFVQKIQGGFKQLTYYNSVAFIYE